MEYWLIRHVIWQYMQVVAHVRTVRMLRWLKTVIWIRPGHRRLIRMPFRSWFLLRVQKFICSPDLLLWMLSAVITCSVEEVHCLRVGGWALRNVQRSSIQLKTWRTKRMSLNNVVSRWTSSDWNRVGKAKRILVPLSGMLPAILIPPALWKICWLKEYASTYGQTHTYLPIQRYIRKCIR